MLACREWEAYARSAELPSGIAKGISAEARRRPLSMTLSLSGSPMEVRRADVQLQTKPNVRHHSFKGEIQPCYLLTHEV